MARAAVTGSGEELAPGGGHPPVRDRHRRPGAPGAGAGVITRLLLLGATGDMAGRHLLLAFGSLGAALAVGLPLGIAIHQLPRLRAGVG